PRARAPRAARWLHALLFPILLPPPPGSTLFPYTTLFRSRCGWRETGFRWRRGRREQTGFSLLRTCRWWKGAMCLRRSLSIRWERSEEHTSELQSRENLVCRLLLEKKKERTTPARGHRHTP